MAATQFTGKLAVTEAYDAYGVATWGIAHGKDLIAVGAGDSELSDWIERLNKHDSPFQYTLRIYRDKEPEDVRQNTPHDYSFKFYLSSQYGGMSGANSKLLEKIDALEKKINGEGEDENEFDLNKIVMGWLSDPNKLATVIGAVKSLITPGVQMAAPVAAIGAVGGAKTEAEEDQLLQRISKVLDRLERVDPNILMHLEKLADIGEKKPETFAFLLKNLDGL